MLSALNIQAATSAGEMLSNLHTREKIGLTDKADVKILPVVTLKGKVMFEHRGHLLDYTVIQFIAEFWFIKHNKTVGIFNQNTI